jgi:hypothetical protein
MDFITLFRRGISLFELQGIHGQSIEFHRKGEARISVLGLRRQNFPVFSRETGKDKAETGSPMTASTAKLSLFSKASRGILSFSPTK